jgi:hypothetical protein
MMALSSNYCAFFIQVGRKGSIKEFHRSCGENPLFSKERIHSHSRVPMHKLHPSRWTAIKSDVGMGPHLTIAFAASESLF